MAALGFQEQEQKPGREGWGCCKQNWRVPAVGVRRGEGQHFLDGALNKDPPEDPAPGVYSGPAHPRGARLTAGESRKLRKRVESGLKGFREGSACRQNAEMSWGQGW